MPDDFTRLLWVLLPLGLCREGRGIDSHAWIRSKIFPLREDIKNGMVNDAMDFYAERGMIVRYQVKGRKYFYLPSFETYQGNTSKERESDYPDPSEASQEFVESLSGVDKTINEKSGGGSVLNTASEYLNIESESGTDKKNNIVPFSELIPDNLDMPEFTETWLEWIAYRKEIRKTLKKTAATRQLNKLAKFDVTTAIAMLDNSMTNQWVGIFELDRKAKGKPTGADALAEYKKERGFNG
jgi:hypothetical protein